MALYGQLNSFSFCFTVTYDLCTLVFNVRMYSSPPRRLAVWMQECDKCTHKVLFSVVSSVCMGYAVLDTALTCDQCVDTLSLALVRKACGSDMGQFPFGSLVDRFCLSDERNRSGEVLTSGPKGFASHHALKKCVVRNCPSCLCSETTSLSWKTCVWVLLGLLFSVGCCKLPVMVCALCLACEGL